MKNISKKVKSWVVKAVYISLVDGVVSSNDIEHRFYNKVSVENAEKKLRKECKLGNNFLIEIKEVVEEEKTYSLTLENFIKLANEEVR